MAKNVILLGISSVDISQQAKHRLAFRFSVLDSWMHSHDAVVSQNALHVCLLPT